MHLYNPLNILVLLGIVQAINVLPTTVTCSTTSTNCEAACGPGYKSCGTDDCYNPGNGELCCGAGTPCPIGTFCSTTGNGCAIPNIPPLRDNCTIASGYSSYSTWTVSSTSPALIPTSIFANTTIISASVTSNLSIITTGSTINNATYKTSFPTSVGSGITAVSTLSTNITYASGNPTKTTSIVQPAKTGAGSVANVAIGAGMAAIWAHLTASYL